jgi:hypothetical protein
MERERGRGSPATRREGRDPMDANAGGGIG